MFFGREIHEITHTCPRFKFPEPVNRTRFFTDETCQGVYEMEADMPGSRREVT